MTGLPRPRANRYGVNWPVRVRTSANGQWVTGTSVNLSITGVLVDVRRQWRIGEVLELELDFPSPAAVRQTIGAIGRVSRTDSQTMSRAAIEFEPSGAARVSRATEDVGTFASRRADP
jgi:hypothetical protein